MKKKNIPIIKNSTITLNKFIYFLFKISFRNKKVLYPINIKDLKKILILRYDAIGDMIVTTPIFEILKNKNPEIKIHVLCSQKNYLIIKYNPNIDEIYIKNKKFRNFIKTIFLLKKQKYDLILGLVFNKTSESGIIANLIGGRQALKVSISHSQRNKLYNELFNILVNVNDIRFKKTMAEIQVVLLSRLFGWNYNIHEIQQRIYISNTIDEIEMIPINAIFYNISAGKPEREISLEKNIELIEKYITKYPKNKILLHLSPNDYHKISFFKEKFQNEIFYVPIIKDILEICQIIKQCKIVITPDTSIVHIGATYKKKIIILSPKGYKIPNEWLPFGTEYEINTID